MSYKAFVSSTYLDLKEHRGHVIQALRKQGIQVDPMEDWTADSDEPKELSVARMRDCDLCILLIGARRGHVPKGEVLSITQMEYREARKRGIHVLAFLYDGTSAWPPKYYELDKDEELVKWRSEVGEAHVMGYFTAEANSLNLPVRDALGRWLQKQTWPEVKRTYLDNIRDTHSSLRFLGIGQYRDLEDCPIDKLFVEMAAAERAISTDTPEDKWPDTTPLLELLANEKRLVLLGDPGGGKSTLVSWIAWNLSREGDNEWKRGLGNPFPLVMILRELDLSSVRCWDDLLSSFLQHITARSLGHANHRSAFLSLLENGDAFLILDGLDEVSDPRVLESLREAVWEGMRRYEKCRWLLTSRVVGYTPFHEETSCDPDDPRSQRETRHARLTHLAPFTFEQIKVFAHNWFHSRDTSSLRADEDAAALVDAVREQDILRLARTPNLLTMMALIHRERAHLPHGRALLYNDIAQAYLQSIDEHKRIQHLGYSLQDQKLWLGRIGFEMQMRRHGVEDADEAKKEILVSGTEVRQWILQAMQASSRKPPSDEAAEAFLDEICRRSGLLLPKGEDQFAFTHLSFQEYFAAVFLKRQFIRPPSAKTALPGSGREDMSSYTVLSMCHETLVLLVELVAAEDNEWLEELLNCLFGEDFNEVVYSTEGRRSYSYDDSEPTERALLLGRLLVNPHAGLEEMGLREPALKACCTYDADAQKSMGGAGTYTGRVIVALLHGELADRYAIWTYYKGVIIKKGLDALRLWGLNGASSLDWSELEGLLALDLSFSDVNDLGPLSSLPALRSLNLAMTQVSDLGPLSSLPALERLTLQDTQVSDLGPLSSLPALERLTLQDTQVSDLGPLSSLPALKALDLIGTQVSDLSPLSSLHALKALDLMGTQVSDLSPLSSLHALKELDLMGTQVSDLSPLSSLHALKELDLMGTQVSDLGPLSSLPALERLTLQDTQVSDLGPLSSLPALERLTLQDTQVSDLGPLSSLPALKALDLMGTQVSDLSPLSSLHALKELDLMGTQVSSLDPLFSLTALQIVDQRITRVSKEEVAKLRKALPECKIHH